MASFFKSCDSYGVPVNVLYKGEDKYQTLCGSFITILAALVVLAYAAVQAE